jgi:hypothetical protein
MFFMLRVTPVGDGEALRVVHDRPQHDLDAGQVARHR